MYIYIYKNEGVASADIKSSWQRICFRLAAGGHSCTYISHKYHTASLGPGDAVGHGSAHVCSAPAGPSEAPEAPAHVHPSHAHAVNTRAHGHVAHPTTCNSKHTPTTPLILHHFDLCNDYRVQIRAR